MFLDSWSPYTEVGTTALCRFISDLKRSKAATVKHRETCPCCGARLVNLYRRDNEWKCRRCWEVE